MTTENNRRLTTLAAAYAIAYASGTDAPEGKQGAWELMALAAIADAEARGIPLFRSDTGKADMEVT